MTEGEIRKAVVVDAPPEVVFKALTDEKELVRWISQEARMDPRLGGECEFKYHWAEKGLHSVATGKILELIPHKRLSYTYVLTRSGSGTSGADSLFPDVTNSVVTWTLDALPDGKTRVTVVHSGITKEAYERFDGAWGYWMGQLARHGRAMAGRSE
jgi:uncharacterized protein YndB with AHSA1/START domain